ncbi:MAG TPA: flagellar biosynthetic protein FliR [Candidatus Avimonas sp.]|nr:flagellar biosynthetic protein FliR [Clostridiales bacterium]HPU58010.1 flagellar biosynthetic protein FliR [Candidatus Avimonas sp.]
MWELVFSNYQIFLLVLMRMTGMIVLNPIFGRKNLPAQAKVGLALFISIIVINVIPYRELKFPNIESFMLAGLKEILVGYAVNFLFQLYISVIVVGSELIDFELGFGMSKIYDPQSSIHMPLTGSLLNAMYLLLFFSSNSHLTFMKIMVLSFEVVPLGTELFNPEFSKYLVDLFGNMLVLAVKLALPVVAVEVISEIGMGVLMKTVPQINVFVVGIQLRLLVGLILVAILLGGAAGLFDDMTTQMFRNINNALKLAA